MVLLTVTGVPWAAEPSGSWLAESLVLDNSFGGLVYKSRKVKLSLPRITNDDLICTTKNVSWRRSYFVPGIAVVTLEHLGFSSTVGLGNGVPHYQRLHPRDRGVMTVISAFLGVVHSP